MTDTAEQTTDSLIRNSIATLRNTEQADTVGRKCSLNINSDGRLTLSTQHPDVNSRSVAIYNGLILSFSLPMGVVPGALADWIEERMEDMQTLVGGMAHEWDGSNMRGSLNAEANEIAAVWDGAEGNVESSLIYLPNVEKWEASDWLFSVTLDIKSQPTREAAVAFALEDLPSDGLWTADNVTSYISREDCAAVAGQWWAEG